MSRIPAISKSEEQELMALSEEDGWISADDIGAQRAYWQQAAKAALGGRRQRISISIPERDLARLKTRAAEEGMPYQTLINSILHKYVES
jgi:predicted DNA binding CopG/RHH family protein